jgi:hypothetical protein
MTKAHRKLMEISLTKQSKKRKSPMKGKARKYLRLRRLVTAIVMHQIIVDGCLVCGCVLAAEGKLQLSLDVATADS